MKQHRIQWLILALWVIFALGAPPAFATEGEVPAIDVEGPVGAASVRDLPAPAGSQGTAASASRYYTEMTRAQFNNRMSSEASAGRQLVDVEIRWTGSAERYAGIWHPVGGTVHTLIQGTTAEWLTFGNNMTPKNGRWLDLEVAYFGSDKRYSAIFLEGGNDYGFALHTTNTDAQFQAYLDQYFRAGRAIVDFEAYLDNNGNLQYAGVWVNAANQPMTHLFYGLESADVSDLLRPPAGRVIDFERYYSPAHSGYRYALILAMYPGGGWGLFRNLSAAELDTRHGQIADDDTHLIDLEMWASGSSVLYGAVWGDTFKSLHEVADIPADSRLVPRTAGINTLINTFEGGSGSLGTIGLYARNVRTNQALSYRPNEPFYIASSAKVAIHIKLWQEIQAGRLNQNTTLAYTNSAQRRDPWYVDERPNLPGFSSADFGESFTIRRFDQAMMQVSDNAATSALVDHPTLGLAHAALDLNKWLSGVAGVGQGFGVVTSIHDVDRAILWQGQVTAFPNDTSYFLVPGWAFEPYFRGQGDRWGDLATFLGVTTFPRYSSSTGHARYYNMGLNSATPKAFGNLLAGLVEERFLNSAFTATAINSMTENTFFGSHPSFPNNVQVRAKGGVKGGSSAPVSDTAIFRLGPDSIVVAMFTKDNTRGTNAIRTGFVAPMGWEVLQALAANLQTCGQEASTRFLPSTLRAGETFDVRCDVRNLGGGDAAAFNVAFYASTDATITPNDYLIGTTRLSGLAGGGTVRARYLGPLPATIPPGEYFVGWIIDPRPAGDLFGEVGEWDESAASNTGYVTGEKLTVRTAAQVYLPLVVK